MKKFLENCSSETEAETRAPWAAAYREADGGWWAFEYHTDADIWDAQSTEKYSIYLN